MYKKNLVQVWTRDPQIELTELHGKLANLVLHVIKFINQK